MSYITASSRIFRHASTVLVVYGMAPSNVLRQSQQFYKTRQSLVYGGLGVPVGHCKAIGHSLLFVAMTLNHRTVCCPFVTQASNHVFTCRIRRKQLTRVRFQEVKRECRFDGSFSESGRRYAHDRSERLALQADFNGILDFPRLKIAV